MQETPKPCDMVEAPDGDRHQLGFGLERELSQCWREVSAVFCCAAPCSTVLGCADRQDLRFGIVQEDPCQMAVGKGPCAHMQLPRVLECLVLSTSQQHKLMAGPADGEQEGGRSTPCSLAASAVWWRLLDAPSAPHFHLPRRPARGSAEPLNANHAGPGVSWLADLLVQMLASASSCVLQGAVHRLVTLRGFLES